jgi:hypothetical protein
VAAVKRNREKEHIQKVGAARIQRAFDLAHYAIRQGSKLVGLKRVREEMAYAAALEATGFKSKRPWAPSKACGVPTQVMLDICAEVFPIAIAAAREDSHND